MSTPDEALADALYRVMPTTGHWVGPSIEVAVGSTAGEIVAALTASGFAIVRSDELAGLRAAARKALVLVAAERIKTPGGAIDVWHANGKHWDEPLQVKRCPWCQAEADLRSALEGVSR